MVFFQDYLFPMSLICFTFIKKAYIYLVAIEKINKISTKSVKSAPEWNHRPHL